MMLFSRIARKWGWLITLIALGGGVVGFFIGSTQPPLYQAQVVLGAESAADPRNGQPDSAMMRTYAALAASHGVLAAAVQAQALPYSAEQLSGSLDVQIIPDTALMLLRVTDADPALSAVLANEIARQLVRHTPASITNNQHEQASFASAEIVRLNALLDEISGQLAAVERDLANAATPEESQDLAARREALQTRLDETADAIAHFTTVLANLQGDAAPLRIIEPAHIPQQPANLPPLQTTLLGVIVGAGLGLAAALLLARLDNTIYTAADAVQTLALPLLGTIARFGRQHNDCRGALVTVCKPDSLAAESYRALHANLITGDTTDRQVYVITSPGPDDGKSVTAANLAVVMAEAGQRVLLVDADLRRPSVHEIFGMPNHLGLSTLLFADPAPHVHHHPLPTPGNMRRCLQDSEIPGLRLITSGFIPDKPAELLGSALMQRWGRVFASASNVDVVLFDTPPCLLVDDSVILAATINASVLLVLRAGATQRGAAFWARRQFADMHVSIRGVILNSTSPPLLRRGEQTRRPTALINGGASGRAGELISPI